MLGFALFCSIIVVVQSDLNQTLLLVNDMCDTFSSLGVCPKWFS